MKLNIAVMQVDKFMLATDVLPKDKNLNEKENLMVFDGENTSYRYFLVKDDIFWPQNSVQNYQMFIMIVYIKSDDVVAILYIENVGCCIKLPQIF